MTSTVTSRPRTDAPVTSMVSKSPVAVHGMSGRLSITSGPHYVVPGAPMATQVPSGSYIFMPECAVTSGPGTGVSAAAAASGLLASLAKCGLCAEQFRPGRRDPLVLPCTHTFCRACCLSLVHSDTQILHCPSCQRVVLGLLTIEHLPVNSQLLILASSFANDMDRCQTHDDCLKYWCRECGRPLCGQCLSGDHSQEHQVLLLTTFIEEQKTSVLREVSKLDAQLETNKNEVLKDVRRNLQKMKQLGSVGVEVGRVSHRVRDAATIEDLGDLASELKALELEKLTPLATEDLKEDEEDEKEDDAEDDDSQKIVLDSQDGRLVLYSAHRPSHSRPCLQLPSEVFLELSVLDRCLGRVYIRLWSHLRRAQQFLALCLGSLGPSHVGATFASISDKDNSRESIWCTEYCSKDGSRDNRDLIRDLEWGGEHRKPVAEGLIVGYSRNAEDYGFGICTRSRADGDFSGPFGEVTQGLDVVRAAIHSCDDHVSQVTISDCGLVLPNFTR